MQDRDIEHIGTKTSNKYVSCIIDDAINLLENFFRGATYLYSFLKAFKTEEIKGILSI